MKTRVLTAVACLALTALPAVAAPIVFNTTGAIVNYAVPVSGQYTIAAVGAKGGDGVTVGFNNGGAGTGGLGAEAGGVFALTQGEVLQILAGAAGTTSAVSSLGGGGGGSFVVGPGDVPLVVAGGGGGGGNYPPGFAGPASGYNGSDALTGPNGGPTVVGPAYPFGTDGLGGTGGANGQGGDFQISGGQSQVNGGSGFNAFPSGLGGGAFGGGGSTVEPTGASAPGGGGGGGYSGGGGGGETNIGSFKYGIGFAGGGGGGSFTAGGDPFLLVRIGAGDGFVTITAVAVPEPGALALFGMGLLGLCAVRQTRRR